MENRIFDTECKVNPLNPNYLVYQDGRIYSLLNNKFMKPLKVYSHNKEKIYYRVMFGDKQRVLITRLVMFVFGDHNYKTIKEMPKVIQLDGDTLNFHIDNLKFADCREINLYHDIKPSEKCYENNLKTSIKIPSSEIEIVRYLRSKNKTFDAIGRLYNVSGMSVYRFIKRHEIK